MGDVALYLAVFCAIGILLVVCLLLGTLAIDSVRFPGRGFLIGLGSGAFTAVLLWGFLYHIVGGVFQFDRPLMYVALTIATILAATLAPPSRSLKNAIGGWLLGFFISLIMVVGPMVTMLGLFVLQL